ncbi:MAG TPA: VOC family protein [Caulobacteraceae bacterium]|nr:VOC family protein [Caulobacteraceae bacterium]
MTGQTRPSFSAAIIYRDPLAALAWLEKAFGFETSMLVTGPDGAVHHSEMRYGDGLIMVGGEFDERHISPERIGGRNTHSVHVQMDAGLDAHCARARAAGASIVREPADQPYGDRVYAAIDPEGHVWSFGQTIQAMTLDEQAAATGADIRERL